MNVYKREYDEWTFKHAEVIGLPLLGRVPLQHREQLPAVVGVGSALVLKQKPAQPYKQTIYTTAYSNNRFKANRTRTENVYIHGKEQVGLVE